MEYKSTDVTFSENHKAKIKSAFKKKSGVTIQFSPDQMHNGKDRVLLTKRQLNKFEKHKKDGKGVRIEFTYNQLRENQKGGLLNELLEFVEDNIPYAKRITPIIRKGGAPLIKDHLVPLITDWLNNELDKVIKGKEGSGLDLETVSYIKDYLIKKAGKKNLNFNH